MEGIHINISFNFYSNTVTKKWETYASMELCLENTSTHWYEYRALIMGHLVALEKNTSIRSVGIDNFYCRLLARYALGVSR